MNFEHEKQTTFLKFSRHWDVGSALVLESVKDTHDKNILQCQSHVEFISFNCIPYSPFMSMPI